MPRIVFLAFYPLSPNRIGGMDRFFWRLDQYARQAGWRITWLFPAGGDYSHYAERGIDVVPLPQERFAEAAAAHLSANGGCDLLVSVFVEYATRYAMRWRYSGAHRYLALDHMSRRAQAAPPGWKDAAKGATVYPFVDAVIAVCAYVKQDIVRRLGRRWEDKVFAVSNGVDTQVYHPAPAQANGNGKPLHVAVVAHLIEEKGIQVLLRALRPVCERRSVKVSIAGSGPYEGALRTLASELGVESNVAFLGATSRQADLLRAADVSVAPSLWAEAFPFSVLESMACGVPVIASRTGGMPEMVGSDAALLFQPGNVDELATSLLAVAEDSVLRRRMGEAGVERTKTAYTVEHMLGGYVSVMRNLLAEPDGAPA